MIIKVFGRWINSDKIKKLVEIEKDLRGNDDKKVVINPLDVVIHGKTADEVGIEIQKKLREASNKT